MRYCLANRFRGNWLGSIIGEALAGEQHQSARLKIVQYQPESWLAARNCLIPNSWSDGRHKLTGHSRTRIQFESQPLPNSIQETRPQQKYQIESQLKSDCANAYPTDRLTVLLLPLLLFYFDNQNLLRQIVTQNNPWYSISPEALEDVLTWGNTIALVFREKIEVKHLIKQIKLSIKAKNTNLSKKLIIVEEALITGKSLTKVIKDLSSLEKHHQIPLALSLYCFGSTPEDFSLAVSLAARTGKWALTTAALTGAIAGSYNGLTGIPINWRMWGYQNREYQQAMKQVNKLYNDWSGVYNLSLDNDDFRVVAVPQTIQPRPQLKIISQGEF